MLKDARIFLLNVAVFGQFELSTARSPYFDSKTLKEYVAAIVLAAFYFWPKDRICALIIRMNNLFPGKLEGTGKNHFLDERAIESFVNKVFMAATSDFSEESYEKLVNTYLYICFDPPQ